MINASWGINIYFELHNIWDFKYKLNIYIYDHFGLDDTDFNFSSMGFFKEVANGLLNEKNFSAW